MSKQRDVALAEVRAGIAELEDALQVLSEFDDEMYERATRNVARAREFYDHAHEIYSWARAWEEP